ncbi:MAG: hypothetical protein CM1200mP2_11290 [Planctomycetaceae bacterium]|nr:MAG: hypothetical protein CM1200mP2_11290 [Planctomycetaceae bacterium]
MAGECLRLQAFSHVLARLDVLAGLGGFGGVAGYCRPELAEEPILDLRESRHPVLDRIQPPGEFVPNAVRIGGATGHMQIITGPNMAGKSTYIRQAALVTILAQMGSFVPASEARVGVADRVFAGVWGQRRVEKGQSTFMVEMTETARFPQRRQSTQFWSFWTRSDAAPARTTGSLWHGLYRTSARPGWLPTLFATHYHELTKFGRRLWAVRSI